MAAKPDYKLYHFHVCNLRSIEIAIKNAALSTRKAISEQNQNAITSFVRLYSFLLGAWAETRLSKLLFEKNGITPDERNIVLSQQTHIDRWHKAVEVAFRKQYNIPSAPLTEKTLPHSSYSRHASLVDILDNDLRSIIEIRNKLAHGQWIYPLNNDGNDVETEKYNSIHQENLLALQFKMSLIQSLASIIHDLFVSLPTFERDFDQHYRQIMTTRTNLQRRKYDEYEKMLVMKRQRGIEKRKK